MLLRSYEMHAFMNEGLVKSLKTAFKVIPAEAGIQ
jgi:hypothetical protein